MASLKDEARAYEPKQTLNIADLDKVDLSFQVENRTGTDKDDKEFSYKAMVVNGIEYRIPNTVLEKIKEMLDLKPDLKFVKVEKSGSGLNTRYAVKKVE
ncbi:MAG: hypothetical protein PHS54_01405 [Clostridia bacterium]|nr:hypothetical protein [Clostridia bacterium]